MKRTEREMKELTSKKRYVKVAQEKCVEKGDNWKMIVGMLGLRSNDGRKS